MFALALPGWAFSQDTSVAGTVSDSENGMPLIGANVIHVESLQGTATDEEGGYTLSGLSVGTNTIRVSFTGYRSFETEVEISEGEVYLLNVDLVPGIDLDQLQITASRRQEKVLDSPSSTDVIRAHVQSLHDQDLPLSWASGCEDSRPPKPNLHHDNRSEPA